MSTHTDNLVDVSTLNAIFDLHVTCGVGYLVCQSQAEWLADGQCPHCLEESYNKTICNSCFEEINAGGRMQHYSCGYRGLGIDFISNFRKL